MPDFNVEATKERIRLTRALMDHPGWRLLVEDWKNEVDVHKHNLVYNNVKQEEVRGWWKGQLNVLERLVNLDKSLDAIEQGLAAPQQGEADE
jgi:hypothetical protein